MHALGSYGCRWQSVGVACQDAACGSSIASPSAYHATPHKPLHPSCPPGLPQTALLGDILDAWSYTVRARLGLFAPHDTQQHTHTAGANGATSNGEAGGEQNGDDGSATHAEAAAAAVDGIMAHHQWIAFMWEVRLAVSGSMRALHSAFAAARP